MDANKKGLLKEDIVPVTVPGKGKPKIIEKD